MLTDQHRAEFERRGVVRLTGTFSDVDAARMRERLWRELGREYGIEQDKPTTWTMRQPTGFQALTRSGAFEALGGPVLIGALDNLLGEGAWGPRRHWGAPLVTFPDRSARWDVPCKQWHLDFPARGSARPLFGMRILALVDQVEPRGGGTLVVTGSHELVEGLVTRGTGAGHSHSVRNALMRMDPWFRALCSESFTDAVNADRIERFMVEGAVVDGVATRVVELSGEAGDAFLMHPWLLHAPAPNCGTSPRLMLSHGVLRAGSAWQGRSIACGS